MPCILHQTLQVTRAASDDVWSQRKVLNQVLVTLAEADWNQPAELLGDAIAQARETLKVADPYAEARGSVHEQFGVLAESFAQRVAAAEDPFALATLGAAAANLVDELVFARFSAEDPAQAFEAALAEGFASGSPDHLREALADARNVLYLLDNAGEVHFDALLIAQMRALGKQVRLAVRGGGLLHDATFQDLVSAGLVSDPSAPQGDSAEPQPIEIAHGQLGVPSTARSTALGAAIGASDLVLAKGSANYETFASSEREVVHLLRAKCPPVAHSLGVKPGGLVLLRVAPSA